MSKWYREKIEDAERFRREVNYYILLTSLEDFSVFGEVDDISLEKDYAIRCKLFDIYVSDPTTVIASAHARNYISGPVENLQLTKLGRELIDTSKLWNVLKFDKKKSKELKR